MTPQAREAISRYVQAIQEIANHLKDIEDLRPRANAIASFNSLKMMALEFGLLLDRWNVAIRRTLDESA